VSANVHGCVYGHRRPTCPRQLRRRSRLQMIVSTAVAGRGDPVGQHATDLSAERDHIPRLDWATGAGCSTRGPAVAPSAWWPNVCPRRRWIGGHAGRTHAVEIVRTMCVHRPHERMEEPGCRHGCVLAIETSSSGDTMTTGADIVQPVRVTRHGPSASRHPHRPAVSPASYRITGPQVLQKPRSRGRVVPARDDRIGGGLSVEVFEQGGGSSRPASATAWSSSNVTSSRSSVR